MKKLEDRLSASPLKKSGSTGLPRRVSIGDLMGDANRKARGLCNPEVYSELSSRSKGDVQGFCWKGTDDSYPMWIPQGVTTTGDASSTGKYDDQQLVVTSWYNWKLSAEEKKDSKNKKYRKYDNEPEKGVRLSFVDWNGGTAGKYRHVLLVEPTANGSYREIDIHAGGIMWYGNLIYVTDTKKGIRVFDVTKIYRSDTSKAKAVGRQSDDTFQAFGYAAIMPQVATIKSAGAKLTYSFISLDRATVPDSFVVGEYATYDKKGKLDGTTNLVRFPLNPDLQLATTSASGARVSATEAYDMRQPQIQGAVARDGRFWFAASHGNSAGRLWYWERGSSKIKSRPWAVSPEDMSYWADPNGADRLWTLTEAAGKRTVLSVPQGDWD